MASIETLPVINSSSKMGARDVALTTGELILMILNALMEPLDDSDAFIVHGHYHKYHLYQCMFINRVWCEWSRKLLWRELVWPHTAFDAVLQQFDVVEAGGYIVPVEARWFNLSF